MAPNVFNIAIYPLKGYTDITILIILYITLFKTGSLDDTFC